MTSKRALLNLNFKPISSGVGYYNLKTSRWKKNTNKLTFTYEEIDMTGTDEEISRFKEINDIGIDHNTDYSSTVERLKNIHYRQLDTFSLLNLRCVGLITRIMDADTMIIMIEIPCKFFDEQYLKKGKQRCQGFYCGEGNNNIIIKLKIRIHSIDTAEKNTKEGKDIKQFAEKIISDNDNIVYLHFVGIGARGRHLAEMFLDPKYTQRYDDLMINYKEGTCCYRYYGGKKK